jgi:hypothetical protein
MHLNRVGGAAERGLGDSDQRHAAGRWHRVVVV